MPTKGSTMPQSFKPPYTSPNPSNEYRREGPTKCYSDRKSTVNVAHNPIQHDHTKRIEVNNFINKKLDKALITLHICHKAMTA